MSQEFYNLMDRVAEDTAREFAAAGDDKRRHVECRITDVIYVYLYEDGVLVQTQHVDIPKAWWDRWPTDRTVRRHVRRWLDLGTARITDLDA